MTASPALELQGVTAGYGRSVVLRNFSLSVPAGKVVALLGANGAGKTTTLRVAAGLLRPADGNVVIAGTDMTDQPPHRRAAVGLCLIPEGRGIFRGLSVADNLRLQQPTWIKGNEGLERALEAFPILRERREQLAGSMSGGQQQMLALARAWLSNPKIVMLDEVSMGLSPIMVDKIFQALAQLSAEGTALLLVEQYVSRALKLADIVVLLDRGHVAYVGQPSEVNEAELVSSYLGSGHSPGSAPAANSGDAQITGPG